MIRLSLLLLIIAGNSYGQKQLDTLCLPTESVRGLVIAAKQGDVLKEQVKILNEKVTLLQTMVLNLEQKDSANTSQSVNQVALFKQEIDLYKDQIKTFEKLLRREKRKRFWASAGGVISTGIMIYLSTKK